MPADELIAQLDKTGVTLGTPSRTRSSSIKSAPPPLARINLRSVTYYTAQEVREGIIDREDRREDEDNVTTNTNTDSEPEFDTSDDEFDPVKGGDYNAADDSMDVDQVQNSGEMSRVLLVLWRK